MKPVPETTQLDVVWGSIAHLPSEAEIPQEFRQPGNRWVEFFERWFFKGLPGDTNFFPREGVDAAKALRAVKAIMASHAPKHEHKTAGIAFLLHEWFSKVEVPGTEGKVDVYV
jgi:hypothetical protein